MTATFLEAYRGRKVLVTGATGFIGWHVARALQDAGAEVYSVSRPFTVRPAKPDRPHGVTVLAQFATAGAASELVRSLKPSIAFNLAGYGVDPSERAVAPAERINTELPAELAAACAEWRDPAWPGQQLVHAGSALEYGTASGDLSEETVPRPTTLYGSTKAAGTTALLRAAERADGRAVVARLFTVYGPREHDDRLLPSLLRATTTDQPIPLTAGTQRRDFTWVGDVVEGLLRLGTLGAEASGIVNLATGRLTTVREFVERAATVLRIAPSRLRFGALPTRPEEMSHDPVTVARLERLTGWRPATSIEEGVRRTAAAR